MTPCRFAVRGCTAPAVVRVRLDKGCVCYRDDREQCLCDHHFYKSTPIGDMEVIEELPGS